MKAKEIFKKDNILLALLMILLSIIDNSVISCFSIYGGGPSLLFVFSIAYCIVNGYEKCLFVGIFSGMLQDIYFFNGFGINCLLNMLLCLAASRVGKEIVKNKNLIPVITGIAATIIKFFAVFLIADILGKKVNFWCWPSMAVCNGIVMFIIYRFVVKKCLNESMRKHRWRVK